VHEPRQKESLFFESTKGRGKAKKKKYADSGEKKNRRLPKEVWVTLHIPP